MKRIQLIAIALVFVIGFVFVAIVYTAINATPPIATVYGDTLPTLPDADDVDDTPRPDDEWEYSDKLGKSMNVSLSRRRHERALELLDELKPRLSGLTPSELIRSFKLDDQAANGVEYYLWRDGNRLVEAELLSRGADAVDALQRYRDDPAMLYTGPSGPPDQVRDVCRRVLDEIAP